MTPIQSLIAGMQAAEHGTPELSEKMADLLGWRWSFAFECWQGGGVNAGKVLPAFTTDLNAILAEIELVFPDAGHKHYSGGKGHQWGIWSDCEAMWIMSDHKTSLPLAACIALLRAIEARDNGETK